MSEYNESVYDNQVVVQDDNESVVPESGTSRLLNSILCAVCGAPLLLLAGVILLGWNERRAVCNLKAIDAGGRKVVEIGCASATEGNGQLVLLTCDLEQSTAPAVADIAQLGDFANTFQQNSHKGTGLAIRAAMYQCVEHEESKTQKDSVGGGTTTIKTYTYSLAWESGPVDSSKFHARNSQNFFTNCGAGNPPWPSGVPHTRTYYANSVKAGPYTLTQRFVKQVPLTDPLAGPPPPGWVVSGDEFTSSANENKRNGIGSMRLSFRSTDWSKPQITALGMNKAGSIDEWTAPDSWLCSGFTLHDLAMGKVSKKEMFDNLRAEGIFLTWVFRFLGWILAWLAFFLCFGPFEVAADCIPCIGPYLGDMVEAVALCVSCLPGTSCCLLVIGIVWVAMRPAVGVVLILVFSIVMCGLAAFKMHTKTQKDQGKGEFAPEAEMVGNREIATE